MSKLVCVSLLVALAVAVCVAQLPPGPPGPGPLHGPLPRLPRPQVPAPGPGPSSLNREATFQVHSPWAKSAVHKSQDIIRPVPIPVGLVTE